MRGYWRHEMARLSEAVGDTGRRGCQRLWETQEGYAVRGFWRQEKASQSEAVEDTRRLGYQRLLEA